MKKKWFFAILIIVVIGIVLAIVFINLFTKKDTNALTDNVNSVTQSGYLCEDNEANQDVDAYLSTLTTLSSAEGSGLAEQKEKIKNYANAYVAFEVMGDFFNRHIVFIEYTNAYKSNYKSIKDNFAKAQDAVEALENYLTQNESIISGNTQLLERSWVDCEGFVENFVKYTSVAFSKLQEVYQASMPTKIINNNFSDIVFSEIDKMTGKIQNGETGYGEKLLVFANAYLSADGEKILLSYSYNIDLQNKSKDIKAKGDESEWYAQFVTGAIVSKEGL